MHSKSTIREKGVTTTETKAYERCRICNLPLRTEKAKRRGYGLKCARKLRRGFGGIQVEMFEDVDKLRRKLRVTEGGNNDRPKTEGVS